MNSIAPHSLATLLAVIATTASAHAISPDGDPSDWTGTPSPISHETVYSAGEWIYTGDGGDMNPAPPGDTESNMDITEVRFTAFMGVALFALVRMRDITDTDEVHIAIGFESDSDPADANGLDWLGDETGVTYGDPLRHIELMITVHTAQPGVAAIEYWRDDGPSDWETPMVWDASIDTDSDVVEIAIDMSDVGLLPRFPRLTVVSFDNDDSGAGVGYNSDKDTTVDYTNPHDAIDVMAGTPGVFGTWQDREFIGGTDPNLNTSHELDMFLIDDVPVELSVFRTD